MTAIAHKPGTKTVTELQLANNTYDEAVRVVEAFKIQLSARKRAHHAKASHETWLRIEECLGQLEAAERREYACWQNVDHLRKVWLAGG